MSDSSIFSDTFSSASDVLTRIFVRRSAVTSDVKLCYKRGLLFSFRRCCLTIVRRLSVILAVFVRFCSIFLRSFVISICVFSPATLLISVTAR